MEQIKTLGDLPAMLNSSGTRRKVAVAQPADAHTEEVVARALAEGVADFMLFGDQRCAAAFGLAAKYGNRVETVEAADDREAARLAVQAVNRGDADVLMKGSLNTDVLLHEVLNKEYGLLQPGSVMSHVTVAQIPTLGRLLVFTDAAVIPYPTAEQFDAMARYAIDVFRHISSDTPRAALIHCTEKSSPKFPQTLSYEDLKKRAAEGLYGDAVLAGPMDVKTALDAESGQIKGISSPVVGRAGILIFPDIEAANAFYKTVTLLCQAQTACLLCGTVAPVVVASRADTAQSKYNSLALACLMGGKGR